MLTVLAISLAMSVLSQLGDLYESYLKRICQIRNSSNRIPSHEEVLDRFDSIIGATLVFGIFELVNII